MLVIPKLIVTTRGASHVVLMPVGENGGNVAVDYVAIGAGPTRESAIDRAQLFAQRLIVAAHGLK